MIGRRIMDNKGNIDIALMRLKSSARFFRVFCKVLMIIMIVVTTISAIAVGVFMAVPDDIFTLSTETKYTFTSDIYKHFEKGSGGADAIIKAFDENLEYYGLEKSETENGVEYSGEGAVETVSARKFALSLVPTVIYMVIITLIFWFLSSFFGKVARADGIFSADAAKDLRIISFFIWGYLLVKIIISATGSGSVTFVELIFATVFMFLSNIYTYAAARSTNNTNPDDAQDK